MTNHKTLRTTLTFALLSAAAASAVVGCKSDEGKQAEAFQDPFFPAQGNVPASETMQRRQYALGAAEDGMLFPVHFDGDRLNSLGRQKLDGILAGTPMGTTAKVYLNLVKDDATTTARQSDVDAYLRESGLTDEAFALAVGPNPGALRPAAAGVDALSARRLEQGDASASAESTNLPVVRE